MKKCLSKLNMFLFLMKLGFIFLNMTTVPSVAQKRNYFWKHVCKFGSVSFMSIRSAHRDTEDGVWPTNRYESSNHKLPHNLENSSWAKNFRIAHYTYHFFGLLINTCVCVIFFRSWKPFLGHPAYRLYVKGDFEENMTAGGFRFLHLDSESDLDIQQNNNCPWIFL